MIADAVRLASGPVLALGLALAAVPVGAETWHVAPNGSDKAPGTAPERAFKTLARATRELKPGDTLTVASGTYYEQFALNRSGEEGKPIVVVGTGPTRPVIKNLDDA